MVMPVVLHEAEDSYADAMVWFAFSEANDQIGGERELI